MALSVGELVAYMSLDDSKFESGLNNAMDGLNASRWASAADQAGDAASDNLTLDGSQFEGGATEAVDSLDSAEFASAADDAGTAASSALQLDDAQYAADASAAADSLDAGEFAAVAGDAGMAASDALELDATGFAADAADAAGAVDEGEFSSAASGASDAASSAMELDTGAFDSSVDDMLGQFDPGEWQASAAGAAGAAVAGLGAGALTKTLIGAGESASTAAGRIEHVAGNLGIFGDDHTAVADRLVENSKRMAQNTGVDPVAIQEAQAMLLTFDSLSDSADTAGGKFDRVTQISMDLAAQGFGSVDQNARMLGRALEDPERGMTRLERMGVVLNDTQKDQVTAMMEAGDAAGAQALLLGEAEKASKGTAEATADASDKMAVSWQLASQSLGEAMLPAFEAFTEAAMDVAEWVSENEELALGLAGTIAGLAGAVLAVNAGVMIYKATMVAWTVATKAATFAQKALNLAMRMNPIGIIITLIAALVAGLIWFFTQTETGKAIWQGFMDWLASAWEWIKTTAVTVFNGIVDAIVGAWNWIKDKTTEIWDTVVNWIKDNWSTIVDFLALLNPVTAVIRHWDKIKAATKAVWDWIVDKIKTVWDGIINAVTTAVNKVKEWISNAWNAIKRTTANVWNNIKNAIGNVLRDVISTVVNRVNRIRAKMVNAWARVKSVTSNAWNNIKNAVSNGISGAVSFVAGLPGRAVSALGNIGSKLYNSGWAMIDGFKNGIVNAFNNAVNAVQNGLQRIRNFFPFSPAKEGPFSGKGYTSFSGEALVEGFADGMRAKESEIVRQAEAITKAAAINMPDTDMGGTSNVGTGGSQSQSANGVTNNFYTYNPVEEPTSETARKASAYIGVSI